jgi:histidinol phosphatase-like PHP family hydrolase
MITKSKMDLLPGLVFKASDIDTSRIPKTDCHLHTSWTDGKNTVVEMYEAAVDNQLDKILFSEHSRKTSVDWFHKFAEEVRQLPVSPCRAYVGTEVKVETRDGHIDTIAEISDQCDFIMASVHRFIDTRGRTMQFAETNPEQSVDIEFELSWAVLENPAVDILGHMFGMSYARFGQAPSEEKIRQLIERAAKHSVAVEVNSQYHPDAHKMVQLCKEYDAYVCFGSNAHHFSKVGAIVRMLQDGNSNA